MTLTLSISGVDRLDNGMPAQFVLNRRGAIIGRSPTCDWSLPDPRHYVSSRHCEVTYRDGFYTLADVSTNGTVLNGAGDRMAAPRRIEQGDRFQVGQYEIVAGLSGEAAAAVERQADAEADAQQAGQWGGWDSHAGNAVPAAPAADSGGWDAVPQAGGGGWDNAPAAPGGWDAAPADGGWAPTPAAPPASGWDEPAASPAGGGWGPAASASSSPSSSWAPKAGPSLARDPAHVAHARSSAAASGAASLGGGWAPPASTPAPGPSTWEAAPAATQGASGWSSAAPDRPAAARPDDVWGKIADGNVVDWARGGFGQPVEEKRDPLGLNKPSASESLPKPQPRMAQFDEPFGAPPAAAPGGNDGWGPAPTPAAPPPIPAPPPPAATNGAHAGWGAPTPAAPPPPPAAPAPTPTARPSPPSAPGGVAPIAVVEAFAAAAGLKPGQLKNPGLDTIERAGALLRQLVAGLVVMVEARARAKSQMGAEATSLNFDGNNPIKFARAPEQAVAQLLNPKERGFMESGPAIEDAFYDLQSHQMATLKAMQGALRSTLDRFSPTAIRSRAESKGLMAKIMPGAKEAALWQAYEREFGGVARGSDEAFMDMFAKEFRKAYEEQSNARRAAAPRR